MKAKDFLIDYVLKAAVGFTVCAAMILPCACAEYLCEKMNAEEEYSTQKVMYVGDNIAIDNEGTSYSVNSDEYQYGDIVSITLNPNGRVVGINGKCWIQSLE